MARGRCAGRGLDPICTHQLRWAEGQLETTRQNNRYGGVLDKRTTERRHFVDPNGSAAVEARGVAREGARIGIVPFDEPLMLGSGAPLPHIEEAVRATLDGSRTCEVQIINGHAPAWRAQA